MKKFLLSSSKVHVIEGYTVAQDLAATTALLQMSLIWILLRCSNSEVAWAKVYFLVYHVVSIITIIYKVIHVYKSNGKDCVVLECEPHMQIKIF